MGRATTYTYMRYISKGQELTQTFDCDVMKKHDEYGETKALGDMS